MSWCETEMQKYMPLVKHNVEVFILGGKRIDQKRNKGWWRGSRERIEMEAQKVTELTIEEEDKEHLHLPLLVSSRYASLYSTETRDDLSATCNLNKSYVKMHVSA